MSQVIHKYVLEFSVNEISTYEKARFLWVDNQSEHITVWAAVNPLERECVRTLRVIGTGSRVPENSDYVGTALIADGQYVFHVYAEREQLV